MTLSEQKMANVNALLEARFGLRVTVESESHLRDIAAHYDEKRHYMRRKFGEGVIFDPNYTKASLIVEAARIMLREICPRRISKKNRRPS